jgi:hypothetical protein
LKAWPVLAILVIQAILLLGHWFVYSTFIAFSPGLAPATAADLRIALIVLAFSFVVASLLSFRYSNPAVRAIYWAAAVWLGFLNFLFWGSILIRLVWLAIKFSHLATNPGVFRAPLAGAIYLVATLTGIYGLINARIIRIRRVPIKIPDLPASWRGRKAVLISDLHLGPINGERFCRRMVAAASQLKPDIVFIPGDLFDGTKSDLDQLVAPFHALKPPFGLFFSTGNHEEFTSPKPYIEAIRRAGIRVLANEQVVVDGLRIAGVLYHDSSSPLHMKAALSRMGPAGGQTDDALPGILLNHAPARLPIVEQAGFSLQLSGHTHGGQFLPFTWITRRVYGRFTSGLHSFGSLEVYTSTGAGTWGPPMRVGTRPEIVLLEVS